MLNLSQSAWAQGTAVPSDSVSNTTATTSSASAPTGTATPQQPSFFGMMMPFLLMLAVVYFLMIRPQQKKMKEHQNLLGGLKHGDQVVTSSGILGKIAGLSDKIATVEIADNVKVKVLKSQISQIVRDQIKEV